jgi:hypothetical protein
MSCPVVGSSVVNLSENEPLWATKDPEIVVASWAELLISVLPNSVSAVVILLASEPLANTNDPEIPLWSAESLKSTAIVTVPDVPPPDKPVPAVTPVMFPASVLPILPARDAENAVKFLSGPPKPATEIAPNDPEDATVPLMWPLAVIWWNATLLPETATFFQFGIYFSPIAVGYSA